MNRPKIFIAKVILVAAVAIVALLLVQYCTRHCLTKTEVVPVRESAASATSTPIKAASNPKASQPQPQQSPVRIEPNDAGEKRLKEAKEHLPGASESELKNLIDRGLNVEEIERGRYRVDNDVSQLVVALRLFRERYGAYPNGTTIQITKALTGVNRDKTVFIDWPEKHRSTNGELLDQWGKPYDIKIENDVVTVRSAGPDGLFKTKDDTVITK